MKARYVYESVNFERGKDPRDAMSIGRNAYLRSLNWGTTPDLIANYLSAPDLEVIEYKGYTILLWPEEHMKGVTLYNPWDSDDIWLGITDFQEDISTTKRGNSRGPGRERTLKNIKRQLNRIIKSNLDESVRFERGKDPKEAMGIGVKKRLEPYLMPKIFSNMDPKELDYILNTIGLPEDEIYYFGDNDLHYRYEEYFDDIIGIIGEGKQFATNTFKDDDSDYPEETIMSFYETPYGKIVDMRIPGYLGGSKDYHSYAGDAAMALHLDILGKSWILEY